MAKFMNIGSDEFPELLNVEFIQRIYEREGKTSVIMNEISYDDVWGADHSVSPPPYTFMKKVNYPIREFIKRMQPANLLII